jgi:hypothetical protein
LALLLFALSGALVLVLRVTADLPKLDETGYPDSYMLYDAEQFRRTGVIYRDIATPPYPPAQYSPLLYVLLSIPGRVIETANPFLGPRLVILLAFVACVAAVASIARAVIPARSAGAWGMLLASSIGTMPGWVVQLRGDFPAAAFSLLSIRLLLGSGQWAAPLSGAAAGLAFQFKITFVAALAAGSVWLLALGRHRDFVRFAAAGVIFALGPYLYFQLREPQTIGWVLSHNLSIRDYRGLVKLALPSAREPVFLLAIAALPLVIGRGRPRWLLLVLFAIVSFAVALVAGTHPGSAANYFFEGLFAVTPLAALGALRLVDVRWRWVTSALLAAELLAVYEVAPNFVIAHRELDKLSSASRLAERRPIEMLGVALPGHRVLSLVPRVALLTDNPIIIEPWFMAYLQSQGRFDTAPIRERIRRQEFEAVVTFASAGQYRGVPFAPPDVMSEIAHSYLPFCVPGPDFVVHLPRGQVASSVLGARLRELGCAPRDTSAIPRSF